jgi:DNA recombination protein RmuC
VAEFETFWLAYGAYIVPAVVGLLLGVIVGFLLDKAQINELKEHNIAFEAHQQAAARELKHLQSLADKKDADLEVQRKRTFDLGGEVASLKTALEKQQQSAEEKLKLLSDAKEQLSKEFELLANRIFEEKNDRFNKSNQATLNNTISPLKEQLEAFRKKVEDVYDKDSKERVSLVAQLSQLKELNQQMSADAIRLTNALKGDNKTQGNWGEVILERVLEESGLRKGHEYETQVALKSEDGRLRKPDVIVRLPENKDIIIDSKVSLNDYERFCNSSDADEREQALAAHIASVRTHIKDLSFKDYEKLEGLRTLDFVFIFIPIEPAFMAAFEHAPGVFKDAYEKNIIVVGPTTLLATLRTVQSIWRYERQNKNAEEIARQAGAMHDKFVGFVEDIDKIAVHIERAADAQASALNKLSSGTGNLVSRTLKLEKLGAKVKKTLSKSVLTESDSEQLALDTPDDNKTVPELAVDEIPE